ncbi:MAG: MalY/PatB family protein [Bacteroidales bacterium]
MIYNFDEIINRENTSCEKWDSRREIFGTNDVIPMWVADMDFRTPDFIIDALKDRLTHEVFGYCSKPNSYYTSIINWVKQKHNWDIKKEWITFSPGVVPALSLIILALTEPNDRIVIQPPVYHPFSFVTKDNQRQIIENPLVLKGKRYFIDYDDLANKLKGAKMLIISNPHNPGGMVWKRDELEKVGKLCVENNVLIISDEIHSDLVFSPNKFTPMASISDAISDKTITCIAPSKTFNIASLATSSVIIQNEDLRNRYEKTLHTIHVGMGNTFGISASEAAYTNGKTWLDQLLVYLSKNINYVEQYIKANIPQINMIRPEGTYLIWLDCRKLNLEGDNLSHFFITKAKVGFNDGRWFGHGGEGFMRMNVACPLSTVQKALDNIKNAIKNENL